MIQVIIGFIIIFIYPFISRMASQIVMALAILLGLIPIFILYDDDRPSYIFTYLIIFGIGLVFRYFVQKSKYNSDADDLINKYKNNKN